jgi:predicted DNA-binding protein
MYYKGGDDMAFSIRLTEEERALAESYAKMHSYSLAEAFKRALFEKIEEEYDIGVFNEAYNEYEEGGKQSRPIEELWKELEL